MTRPILYSLRNCPYAMRARLAIFKSKLTVELRDVVLSNKPKAMLTASAKGTVPIIVLPSGQVIDESLSIMLWALNENDPNYLLGDLTTERQNKSCHLPEMLTLIQVFDDQFKGALEQYRCAKRYHEKNIEECRIACEVYIKQLEQRLSHHNYLFDNNESLADIALMPFIRQFAKVERQWYLQSPYPNVRRWLNSYLQSATFTKVMAKYPTWSPAENTVLFGDI